MPNKIKLKVVKTAADYDPKTVKGRELFKDPYSNIYIAGRKKSGKTQLLYNILDHCAARDTKVMLFGSTVNKDPTYIAIQKLLDRKGIDWAAFEHFITENNEDLLEKFISDAKERTEAEQQEEQVQPVKYTPLEKSRVRFGDELPQAIIEKKLAEEEVSKEKVKKVKKVKILSPEYILCFDDLGEDMRKKSISQLLIKNRHFKCKTIILSQWISYLTPISIRQLDYVLLYGGFNDEKLEDLHVKLDLSNEIDEFIKIYREATAEKYNFLYISIADNEYRKNFDPII
jgi:hypothetical protein